MMKKLLLFLFSLMLVAHANAQIVNGVEIITPTAICGTQNFTKAFTLGIKCKIETGWHTYWKNPGDSGIPFEISVDSTSGYKLGEVQYPTPKKIVAEGSVSYGYEDSVVFLVRVTPITASTSPKLTLHLKWLVCKSSCIPGKKDVFFDASTLTAAELKANKSTIDRWTARMPQPGIGFNLESTKTTVTPIKDGYSLLVEFGDMNPGTLTDFYPEVIEGFVVDYSRIELLPTGFKVPLQFEDGAKPITKIRGIALLDRQGYDVTIPVKQ